MMCFRGDKIVNFLEFLFLGCEQMDGEKRERVGGAGGGTEKTKTVVDVDEALRKCLEENKGDTTKCRSVVEAFKSSTPPRKPIRPLRLRSGSLTDV
ncbi:unnamed protein product [Ilex paraguariensis]|uniref:Uncharacterized protein n=1 Tax=Ilex paraguariensis TaxID=185542 RepID=A0ABC8QUH9_9AQUA